MPENVILDTTIYLAAFGGESVGVEECERILRRYINSESGCIVPVLVPGEVIRQILDESSDKQRVEDMLRLFKNRFIDTKFEFIGVDDNVMNIYGRLSSILGLRIRTQDKLIVASAIANKCNRIITLDKDLYEDREKIMKLAIEYNVNLKIENPIYEQIAKKKRKY